MCIQATFCAKEKDEKEKASIKVFSIVSSGFAQKVSQERGQARLPDPELITAEL